MPTDHASHVLMHELALCVRPLNIVACGFDVGQGRGGVDRPVSSAPDFVQHSRDSDRGDE